MVWRKKEEKKDDFNLFAEMCNVGAGIVVWIKKKKKFNIFAENNVQRWHGYTYNYGI